MVERWRETLLAPGSSIQDAILCLERSGLKIVLAVDEQGALLGTISDGDIRRGLLRGCGLGDDAETVMHRQPLVVPAGTSFEAVFQLMRANQILQMPVVGEGQQVIGLYSLEELLEPAERTNRMVIMAGGKGARLGLHTRDCPKPLLPVGDKPIIEHILTRARDEGFRRFVIAVHHFGSMIEEHLGDGSRWGVEIEYSREEQPLGTAGALSLLEPRPSEPFLVTNGDVITSLHYNEILDFHRAHNAAATMAVRSFEWQHPFGVVRTRGIDITGFEEKPLIHGHVNAGIYVLDPAALDHLERDCHCDMPALFERLQAAGQRTVVYPMHETWVDIGSPEELERARQGDG